MNKYLFCFGYCFPEQWIQNELHGWDDEDSIGFFVIAPNREAALAWGREVAEGFVTHLFAESEAWTEEPPSWKEAEFAHWIIDEPYPKEYTNSFLATVPVIRIGQMPSFDNW